MPGSKPQFRNIETVRDVACTLSDGTKLYADIYRPAGGGRFPVVVNRTPYNKGAAQAYAYAHPVWYARHGYVVVVQDTRGRWRSDGEFYPVRNEASDGIEVVAWAADLPYSNGRVGLYGYSYVGLAQLLTAARRPPALAAIAPAFTGSDHYSNWTYNNGAFSLGFNAWWTLLLGQDTARRRGQRALEQQLGSAARRISEHCWTLPLGEFFPSSELRSVAPYYYDWLAHPRRDTYWQQMSPQERYDDIAVPAFHIGGWYDTFVEGTLRNFTNLASRMADRRHEQRLVVGPWYHNPWASLVGQTDFGPEAAGRVDDHQLQWFDRWLKDAETDLDDLPPIQIFVMGENTWRSGHEWPPASVSYVDYYLHSAGRANSISGNGALSHDPPGDEWPDVFMYDPRDPVPSLGGRSCCVAELTPMGPANQRRIAVRNDVLVYATGPLQQDLEVTGPVTAILWASSTAPDTDFTVTLVDVHPSGCSINLCDGIVRARYRDSMIDPQPLVPGEAYRYEVQVGSTSNLFRRGHRIGVLVSSSNFPTYDRNANTGSDPGDVVQDELTVATQTIFHDSRRVSLVRLPVIPR